MCPGQPWPLFPLLMGALSSLWLIKHPLRSGSHGGWCNLSSGSCVMECGLLQSLSLRVINSAVASKAWKDTAHGLVSSKNQIEFASGNQTGVTVISRLSPWAEQFQLSPNSTTCNNSLNVLPALFCCGYGPFPKGTLNIVTLNLKQLNHHQKHCYCMGHIRLDDS